jgi:hypothetical protein
MAHAIGTGGFWGLQEEHSVAILAGLEFGPHCST